MRPLIPVLSLACSLLALPAVAQDPDFENKDYLTYCATCHGLDARGNGPMGSMLMLQPADLTVLAKNNGGVFPRTRVIARIDGRDPLIAHGSPMPVYGDFFEGKGVVIRDETGLMIMTSQPIVDLVEWLETMQE